VKNKKGFAIGLENLADKFVSLFCPCIVPVTSLVSLICLKHGRESLRADARVIITRELAAGIGVRCGGHGFSSEYCVSEKCAIKLALRVMHLRSIIALFCVATTVVAAIAAVAFKPVRPVELRVVDVTKMGPTNLVEVEFRRCNPSARFAETHRMRLHIGGQWQPPVSLPALGEGDLLGRTN